MIFLHELRYTRVELRWQLYDIDNLLAGIFLPGNLNADPTPPADSG